MRPAAEAVEPGSLGAGVERDDHGRVAMVEEQRGPGVKAGDAGHLLVCELEVEDVDVLAPALRTYRLRDDDDAALGQPAEDDLPDGLPCAAPISLSSGLEKRSFLPSANGPQDSIWMPRSRISSWSAVRWKNGSVSIWLTAGVISLWSRALSSPGCFWTHSLVVTNSSPRRDAAAGECSTDGFLVAV